MKSGIFSDVHDNIKNLEEARRVFARKKIKKLLIIADGLLEGNQYDEAEIVLNKVMALDENNAECLYNLGEVYCKQERFEDSIRVLKKANALLSNNPRILHLLGWATFMNGDARRGRDLLLIALKKLPNDLMILCDLAVLENQQGNGKKSEEYALAALGVHPDEPRAQEVFAAVTFFNKLRENIYKKDN